MALIDIDYQDTLKKADRLESLANDLQSISTRNLQDLQASMSRTWRGSASELCKKRTQTFPVRSRPRPKNYKIWPAACGRPQTATAAWRRWPTAFLVTKYDGLYRWILWVS